MSHYPTSAELAAFRYRTHGEDTDAAPSDCDNCPAYAVPDDNGAWPDELRGGIGYTGGSPTAPFLMHEADGGPFPMGYAVPAAWADAYDHSWARRVAGAMRTRAYTGRNLNRRSLTDDELDAWMDARLAFVPVSPGDRDGSRTVERVTGMISDPLIVYTDTETSLCKHGEPIDTAPEWCLNG